MESIKEGWDVIELKNDHIHVVPVNDVVFHEMTDECPCQPQVEPCLNPDETVTHYWLVTHAAWDGRL
jgi:hypothetical protein